jgi:spermidine/putrescine-binding protein
MMWLWISFLVILAGAELDQEIAHEFANDAADSKQLMGTQDKPDGSSEIGGRFSSTR